MIEFSGRGDKAKTLMQILQEEKQYIPAYCAGRGVCGKCGVYFQKGATEPTEDDRFFFSEEELSEGKRLACRSVPDGDFTVLLPEKEHILTKEDANDRNPEETAKKTAVALDLGTTTLVAALVDVEEKKIVKTLSAVNRQRMYGVDVLSRIEAALKGNGETLKALVREDINCLLKALGAGEDIPLMIAGNSVMRQLYLGESAQPFIKPPFTGLDLSFRREGSRLFLPGAGAFLGSDIISGIIATGMDQKSELSVLLDIGTNGEIVIGNKDRLMASSAAAGPALEGGNIECGCAGIPGAIFDVELENRITKIRTLEEEKAIGICGTGVLETVYELRKAGIVDETGCMEENYRKKGFLLTPEISFTAKDVREVQLAKSAIRAAFETLREEYGAEYQEIDALYLAGNFGQAMDVRKAAGIGLIPEELVKKTIPVQNTSLLGACKLAWGETGEERYEEAARRVQIVELSDSERFGQLFMNHMTL